MRSRLLAAAAALTLAAGATLAAAQAPAPIPASTAAAASAAGLRTAAGATLPRYRVQPGDLLTVSVWKEKDLQSEVLVLPDGGLSFPLAGQINAEGMTVEELQNALIERLRRYIPDPVVSVAIKAIGGNRVYVIGKVSRPGEFTFSRPLDVMQALSLAGGATPFAALNDIVILRRENPSGLQRVLPFRYADVEHGRGLRQNVLLESGDTVVVP